MSAQTFAFQENLPAVTLTLMPPDPSLSDPSTRVETFLVDTGDAAHFANPALYRVLEKDGYHDAIRIHANAVLEREIEHLLTRRRGTAFAQAQGV